MTTKKQEKVIGEIIEHFGRDRAKRNLRSYHPKADLDNLNKEQAQTLITTLGHDLPRFNKANRIYNPEQYFKED